MRDFILFLSPFLLAGAWMYMADPCRVDIVDKHEHEGKACPEGEVMTGGKSLSPTVILCAKVKVSCG